MGHMERMRRVEAGSLDNLDNQHIHSRVDLDNLDTLELDIALVVPVVLDMVEVAEPPVAVQDNPASVPHTHCSVETEDSLPPAVVVYRPFVQEEHRESRLDEITVPPMNTQVRRLSRVHDA